MKLALVSVVVALLAGCAAPASRPQKPPSVVNTKTPECISQIECDRMWLTAQDVIQQVSGMRLRMSGDSRIETFAASSFSRMTGTVVKYPMGGGVYEVQASLECYRASDCRDLRASAINLFNLQVGAVSLGSRPLKSGQ